MYEAYLEGDLRKLQTWLYQDNSIIIKEGARKKEIWKAPDTILIKIGMTRKTDVKVRFKEWMVSCHHEIIGLTPENMEMLLKEHHIGFKKKDNVNTITHLFKKLSLKKASRAHGKQKVSIRIQDLYTYKNGGFFTDGNGKLSLEEIENLIHRILWKKYGKGIIYCSGCNHTHTEWFKIPIKDLPFVIQTIDSLCLAQKA
ncbi:hypothetical protein NCAS_0B05780 [Naumovozyma castellii]|uniref:Bacteriophage T5 Orf172 DNA-binding domain-containing protein n=1 Tax=Naumovozyma castellii TaxID=27288 RepID=G0V9P5_NAUCA|nr:hypothetical protein NCAS_0B05780 [Naumovozyma castellii CBS 4309]CCC68662.1 hypothetical protein NCAS_0B05780 [Naumovozyma castellii CBS 4309]